MSTSSSEGDDDDERRAGMDEASESEDGDDAVDDEVDEWAAAIVQYNWPYRLLHERESSSNLSNNQEDDMEDESQQAEAAAPAAPARDHAYLPGTSHPLFPESLLRRRRFSRAGCAYSSRKRLKRNGDDQRIDFHDREMERDDVLEIPIMELDGVVVFPGSTLPLRLLHPSWVAYIGQKIERARSLHGTDVVEDICIGVITKRREALDGLVRRRWGRRRLPERGSQRMQRIEMPWFRRAINLSQQELDLQQIVRVIQEHEAEIQNRSGSSDDTGDEGEQQQVQPPPRPQQQQRQQRPNSRPQHADPLVGRIGTLVTITCTHEHLDGTSFNDAQDQDQLALTALGTGRFRIIEPVGEAGRRRQLSVRRTRRDLRGDFDPLPMYYVEDLCDSNLPLPPATLRHCVQSRMKKRAGDRTQAGGDSCFPIDHQARIIENMSNLSPLPAFVYQSVWPWRQVRLIQECVKRVFGEEDAKRNGLLGKSVAEDEDGGVCENIEPLEYSFLLASNLPLSEDEKLELLTMNCTVERLRTIREKLIQLEEQKKKVACRHCGVEISTVDSMFAVGGAEGTTGAYVNEYGVVHQTLTFRNIKEDNVACVGRAETKDSWFPGYSWTIAVCRGCSSHLGWKFLRVGRLISHEPNNSDNGDDRPYQFWGLSGSSVTSREE